MRICRSKYGAWEGKSTDASARCGRAAGAFAVFAAQLVDALIKPLQGLAPLAVEQRFLPTRAFQRAGAHAEETYRAAAGNILPQQRAHGLEDFLVEAGRRR